jgi:hypothetical protein
MNFSDITERQPWLGLAWDCGQDLNAAQVAEPRIFKSHLPLSAINQGAKYISIIRDPGDVLLSMFSYGKAKGLEPFVFYSDANEYLNRGHEGNDLFDGAYLWEFYTELWRKRTDPSVMVLCYEALAHDEAAYLPMIADFLGLPWNAGLMQKVGEMTSSRFMASHAAQFDDGFIEQCAGDQLVGPKIREVAAKQEGALTHETISWLQSRWLELVLPQTGLRSYEVMATAVSVLPLRIGRSRASPGRFCSRCGGWWTTCRPCPPWSSSPWTRICLAGGSSRRWRS